MRIDSSFIKRVSYKKGKRLLKLEMISGTYEYSEVPKRVFKDFLKASSAGRFYNSFIKGEFLSQRIQ
jgi:hypothetical protein